MALFGKFLYRKLPEGLLLEISERVFVFVCCFTTNLLEDTEYHVYIGHIVNQLREYFSDTSFNVHNFAEENYQSQISNLLSKYGITVMNYPHQYASCLLLPLETIHHFLNSSVNWLSIGQRNVLLMHCENGALSVLAFMLAAFLIYSKQYTDEWKTLDMIYKQVPQELLQMLSSVNLLPLQLRYLEYVSTRKIDLQWAPTARVLKLDCVVLRFVPDMDGKGGCRPIVRIYGLDADQTTKMLFSMPTKSEAMRYFKQADLELVKIDINCHVRGDVVLECVALDDDSLEHEEMMFHVMFNTAFIRSNTLALNLEEIDTLWNVKDRPPKDFRAEVLFSEMDSSCSLVSLDLPGKKGKEDFPMEACGKIQDIFSNIDSRDSEASNALAMIKQMEVSIDEQLGNVFLQNDVEKRMTSGSTQNEAKSSTHSPHTTQKGKFSSVSCDSVKDVGDLEAFENVTTSPPAVPSETPPVTSKTHNNSDYTAKKIESSKLQQVSVQRLSQPKIILPRISSSQVSSVPLSRYHSAISALGITAILQDHAEFSSNEARCPLTPESSTSASPPLPLPPHPSSIAAAHPCLPSTLSKLPPPPPSPPLMKTTKPCSLSSLPSPHPIRDQPVASAIPPPPPPPCSTVSIPAKKSTLLAAPSPPPPPQRACSPSRCSPSPPMCPPRSRQVVPSPPAPLSNGLSKSGCTSLQMHSSPLGAKGKLQLQTSTRFQAQQKKTSLKPYHWLKLTRAMQGSLWAEAQKPEEASNVLELDISELESLFSTTFPNSNRGGTGGKTDRRGLRLKPDKVHLIELRRAYNCEIMLTKVKVPLSDLMTSVLALDDSALDIDQVDNLIKFCPTKAEIELLKNYTGDKENLGKCEQFFLELMKVPRVESKLRVFSFKIQFCSQVSDLRNSLNIVNSASQEVRNSVKLKRIMQSILSLGNALNHGTARGSAVGFRLDSLLKLSETRSRNNKLTLIHYLCKVLAEKLPEVLDFYEDLVSLEDATKIQLKYLAEEMQAISKGLEKVVQELTASENDGAVTKHFCKTLTGFYVSAEEEVRSLASTYSVVGRNADALAVYFGEDPARCPFEQVVSTLLNFVRMFRRAHEENCKQMEFEKKKAQKELEIGKGKSNASRKELEMRF